jgi:hypothetical protein
MMGVFSFGNEKQLVCEKLHLLDLEGGIEGKDNFERPFFRYKFSYPSKFF